MLAGVAEDALDTAQDRQTHSRPGNQPGLRVSLAPCLVWRATGETATSQQASRGLDRPTVKRSLPGLCSLHNPKEGSPRRPASRRASRSPKLPASTHFPFARIGLSRPTRRG